MWRGKVTVIVLVAIFLCFLPMEVANAEFPNLDTVIGKYWAPDANDEWYVIGNWWNEHDEAGGGGIPQGPDQQYDGDMVLIAVEDDLENIDPCEIKTILVPAECRGLFVGYSQDWNAKVVLTGRLVVEELDPSWPLYEGYVRVGTGILCDEIGDRETQAIFTQDTEEDPQDPDDYGLQCAGLIIGSHCGSGTYNLEKGRINTGTLRFADNLGQGVFVHAEGEVKVAGNMELPATSTTGQSPGTYRFGLSDHQKSQIAQPQDIPDLTGELIVGTLSVGDPHVEGLAPPVGYLFVGDEIEIEEETYDIPASAAITVNDVDGIGHQIVQASVLFNPGSEFTVGVSSDCTMTLTHKGAKFVLVTDDPDLLTGLLKLTLVFTAEVGEGDEQEAEVGGYDFGVNLHGWAQGGGDPNFNIYTLALAEDAVLKLVDVYDNDGTEADDALYVEHLVMADGATLDLNGLHLYVMYPEYDEEEVTIENGTVILTHPGDADLDGDVDLDDLFTVRNNLGTMSGMKWEDGDFDGDGDVDLDDLFTVQNEFGWDDGY